MSVFHGKQGKGAKRAHRADKTREAVERQARFDANVARFGQYNAMDPHDARVAVRLISTLRHITAVAKAGA